jgi:KaiC/GvpD/RAD55 family RecA-like ATPase
MPAVGKSTLVRQIAANWVRKGLNVLLVPFEEQGIKYFAQVVGMVNNRKLLKDTPQSMSERLELFDSVKEHLHLSTMSLSDDTRKMKDYLEYACRSLDIHLVVFDNITKYTSVSSNQTQDIGTVMAYLVAVAQTCNTHVICVSHTSRDKELKDGQAPSMQAGYNSGSIERFSDTVITMGRRPESNLCRVAVRKDRANNHVGEFDIEFNYESYTFKGVTNGSTEKTAEVQQDVRLEVRESGSGSLPDDETDTEPNETRSVHLRGDTPLQPRLHSGVPGTEVVCGSEGETVQGGCSEVQPPTTLSTWDNSICLTKQFPTIQPAKFHLYL